MTEPSERAGEDFLLRATPVDACPPLHHVLVIGVSRYDHLPDGDGPLTTNLFARGLSQLAAAAASAVRVAFWFRDEFDSPSAARGTVRLLASPQPNDLPLPGGITPAPATADKVSKALADWRHDVRAHPDNVAVLYVAGHGIQLSHEGGILLLQDFGHPADGSPLERAVDVAAYRRGVVGDPNLPGTCTPQRQFYFYDACRVRPPAANSYHELRAGITSNEAPIGEPAAASWVSFGAKDSEYALADTAGRMTLYSEALLDCLKSRAPADRDGITVSMGQLHTALEEAVRELADRHAEVQDAILGGAGKLGVAVHRRARKPSPVPQPAEPTDDGGPSGPVTFVCNTPTPVEVRRQGGDVIGEFPANLTVDIPVGDYEAVVPLPWVGTESDVMPFTVTPDAEPRPIDVQVSSSWRYATRAPTRRLPDRDGAEPAYTTRPPIFVRFLEWRHGRFEPHSNPSNRSVHRIPGGLRIAGSLPAFLEIFRPDESYDPSLVVALPVHYDSQCDVIIDDQRRRVMADVRLADRDLDAVSGYLTAGRPDRALAAFDLDELEMLLFGKLSRPLGAALAGYALLALDALDRMHDWPDNLADWIEWLPDGAVIAGACAQRQRNPEKARHFFSLAAKRGLPLFSRGLSLLVEDTPRLPGMDDSWEEIMRVIAPYAEFRSLATVVRPPTAIGDDDGYVNVNDLPTDDGPPL